MTMTGLDRWYACAKSQDARGLLDLLHPEVVFESPVVHTPQRGRDITFKYLASALKILNGSSFAYRGEKCQTPTYSAPAWAGMRWSMARPAGRGSARASACRNCTGVRPALCHCRVILLSHFQNGQPTRGGHSKSIC